MAGKDGHTSPAGTENRLLKWHRDQADSLESVMDALAVGQRVDGLDRINPS